MKRNKFAINTATLEKLSHQLNDLMNPAADFYCPKRERQHFERGEKVDINYQYQNVRKYQND